MQKFDLGEPNEVTFFGAENSVLKETSKPLTPQRSPMRDSILNNSCIGVNNNAMMYGSTYFCFKDED